MMECFGSSFLSNMIPCLYYEFSIFFGSRKCSILAFSVMFDMTVMCFNDLIE